MISIKSVRTKALATLVAGVAAGATLLVPSAAQASGTTTTAATAPTALNNLLLSGQSLKPGQFRRSANNLYTLRMQTDGNAVLIKGRTAIWGTMTNRKSSSLVMQRDGNLVVISGRTVVWASNTAGSTGAKLAVQDDSNLVLYNVRNKAVWTRAMVLGTLGPNRALKAGQALFSTNRIYRLMMQTDGNLVLVKNGKTALWGTGTGKNPGAWVVMQSDGNLIVYTAANKPLWSSKTAIRTGSVLQMLNTGNAVIVHGRTTVWATNTAGR
ncbi:hypothetical protein AB0L70_08555 [Kribbella sp. NPDC051952]|uniref:hypothetical protein n=1 Tax=Kribbella sp. NPDC051952 TaxID=3154851 RepID=UPI0034276196